MRKRPRELALILPVMALIAGCGSPAQEDRDEGLPFGSENTEHVTVWRNVDKAPNLVTFCAGQVGWVTTLNSGSASEPGGYRGELQRFFDMDLECGTEQSVMDDQRDGKPR